MKTTEKLRIGATVIARVFDAFNNQYKTFRGIVTDYTGDYVELDHAYIIHVRAIKQIN